jgi:hypothetical protein
MICSQRQATLSLERLGKRTLTRSRVSQRWLYVNDGCARMRLGREHTPLGIILDRTSAGFITATLPKSRGSDGGTAHQRGQAICRSWAFA